MKRYLEIKDNRGSVKLDEIPVLDYGSFTDLVSEILAHPSNHCIDYFAVPSGDGFRFLCLFGKDDDHSVLISSFISDKNSELSSLSAKLPQLQIFERIMHEKHDIKFSDHPWLKPVRMHDKFYPFYRIEGEQLHEVGVGPVHAGVIEPGHFRFICNGEKVLHLEIQLGYQHRGVERLMIQKGSGLERIILAENIAGDTAIGHALTHSALCESLSGTTVPDDLVMQRMVALELERIAVHIGDTAALCTDTAYQFGQVVCEALRTIVINTTQMWCGNRFGKGLIRPGGTRYPLNVDTISRIRKNLEEVEGRFADAAEKIYTTPGILNRFEGTGRISRDEALAIGAVGMAARSSGLKRDIRWSHPEKVTGKPYEPVVFSDGDVRARGMVRRQEVFSSCKMINDLLEKINGESIDPPVYDMKLPDDSLAFAVTEGWRGEICHTAVTGAKGKIVAYNVKDPSLHNWMALALAVRGEEISDFPLCNKSFNLSYCGNDL